MGLATNGSGWGVFGMANNVSEVAGATREERVVIRWSERSERNRQPFVAHRESEWVHIEAATVEENGAAEVGAVAVAAGAVLEFLDLGVERFGGAFVRRLRRKFRIQGR